ncbi:methyltransferase domain-containing protein [Candidatus Woesearchaeota archaeon]|nr:methyltransferase domain-containing protein [Candidatus Woesearchaeota archaeon]
MMQTQTSESYRRIKTTEGVLSFNSFTLDDYLKERVELNEKEINYQNAKIKIREKIADGITFIYKAIFKPKKTENEALCEIINREKNKKTLLEEGAGNDTLYLDVLGKIKPEKYYRSDVSENQLNQVQDLRVENIIYDGIRHDIEDNSIDIAFSKCVLHHIDNGCEAGRERNRIDYLIEQKRIVKEGGKVITVDVNDPRKGNLKAKFWHYIKHRLILGEEEHNFLDEQKAVSLYHKAGFKNITNQKVETYKGTYFIVIGEK